MYFLIVQEARILKSTCQQSQFLLGPLRKSLFHTSLLAASGCNLGVPWFIAISLGYLILSSHNFFFSIYASFVSLYPNISLSLFFFLKIQTMGFRAHLYAVLLPVNLIISANILCLNKVIFEDTRDQEVNMFWGRAYFNPLN